MKEKFLQTFHLIKLGLKEICNFLCPTFLYFHRCRLKGEIHRLFITKKCKLEDYTLFNVL